MLNHLAMCVVYVSVAICVLCLPVLFWIKGTMWLGRKLEGNDPNQDTATNFLFGLTVELICIAALTLLFPLCKLGQWIVSNL